MRHALGILAFAFIVIVIGNLVIVAQEEMKPPVAKKVPKVLKIHGYEIVDNYGWLRDRNEKKDPAVIEYLTAENQYTESFMGQHDGFVAQRAGRFEHVVRDGARLFGGLRDTGDVARHLLCAAGCLLDIAGVDYPGRELRFEVVRMVETCTNPERSFVNTYWVAPDSGHVETPAMRRAARSCSSPAG